jgi:hypothetical protein
MGVKFSKLKKNKKSNDFGNGLSAQNSKNIYKRKGQK